MERREFLKRAAVAATLTGLQSATGQATSLDSGQMGAAAHTSLPIVKTVNGIGRRRLGRADAEVSIIGIGGYHLGLSHDYPEYLVHQGLNLLCTPGSDVECVTAQVGAGANMVLFTTGLGTPTGNPIAPVVKVATNTRIAEHMSDIIDIDTGAIIRGEATIKDIGASMLERVLDIASGKTLSKAEVLGQNDFIPWKRGVSL